MNLGKKVCSMSFVGLHVFAICICTVLAKEMEEILTLKTDAVEEKLNHLSQRFEALNEQLESWQRQTRDTNRHIRSLSRELDRLPDDICKDTEFKCSDTPQCVNSILVCDGTTDCKNGADEETTVCTTPLQTYAKYAGNVIYNHCFHVSSDQGVFLITGMELLTWITDRIRISRLYIAYGTGRSASIRTSTDTAAVLDFGKRELRFSADVGGRQLLGVCSFDNYNDRLIHCALYSQIMGRSVAPCAYAYYLASPF